MPDDLRGDDPRGDTLTLAEGFEPVGHEQWEQAVADVLRGRPASSLDVVLPEGITVAPLATIADAREVPPLGGRGAAPWGIRVRAVHPDPDQANDWLLEDLAGGATEVSVRLDRSARTGTADGAGDTGGVGDDGVNVRDAADLRRVLDEVLLDLAPIALEPGASFAAAGAALLDLLAEVDDPATASLGADPIGALAEGGTLPQGIDAALADLADLARRAADGGHRAVAVGTHAVHGAGATEELDLAVALSTSVAYLRAMVAGGLDVDAACRQVEWRLPVGVDQFVAIAKLRAARRLWARVAEASGASPAARVLRLHADTAASVLTTRDPWVNLLRGTMTCFAAGVGGADSVAVHPYDAPTGVPGLLGRRLARNTQLVLQREAHLARLVDPAGGSWHVEQLTDDLARRAWDAFRDLERRGGVVAALLDGSLAADLGGRRAERDRAVATRRRPVTGVSEFPDVHEDRVDAPSAPPPADARPSDLRPEAGDATTVEPLPVAPVAAAFEALRDAADRHAERTGARPRVLLACLGPVARHNARATFAKNAFEAGGVEAVTSDPLEATDDVVAAWRASGADLACACGDDEQYAESGAEVVAALRDAGASTWVAGRPDEALPADGFVHLGCDLVAVLEAAHDAAGVQR